MSATATHNTLAIEDLLREGDEPRRGAYVGRELGVRSFQMALARNLEAGPLVNERTETGVGGDRHEKVWLVLSGHAVFTVDGEEVDAPAGTVVHVADPEVKRSAVAKEPGTTLLGLGGRPGLPYRPTPGEALAEFFPLHTAGDFEGAASVAREVLETYEGDGLALYNLACCEAQLGRSDGALSHLTEALAAQPALVENARDDVDFESIRGDSRFAALVA